MTDRLTPPQLRDLGDILRHQGLIGTTLEIAAARREAEQGPIPLCSSPDELAERMQERREGPGSAAALHAKWCNKTTVSEDADCSCGGVEDKPAPAPDELLNALRQNVGSQYQKLHDLAADRILAEKARADRLAVALRATKGCIEYERDATTPKVAQDWSERALATITVALASEGGDRAKA